MWETPESMSSFVSDASAILSEHNRNWYVQSLVRHLLPGPTPRVALQHGINDAGDVCGVGKSAERGRLRRRRAACSNPAVDVRDHVEEGIRPAFLWLGGFFWNTDEHARVVILISHPVHHPQLAMPNPSACPVEKAHSARTHQQPSFRLYLRICRECRDNEHRSQSHIT